jgi:hypothetical protein
MNSKSWDKDGCVGIASEKEIILEFDILFLPHRG